MTYCTLIIATCDSTMFKNLVPYFILTSNSVKGHQLLEQSLRIEPVNQAGSGNIHACYLIGCHLWLAHNVTDGYEQFITRVIQNAVGVGKVTQILTVELMNFAKCSSCYMVQETSMIVASPGTCPCHGG